MFSYMSVVVAIGIAVIWAGIADVRYARQTGGTGKNRPEEKASQNRPGEELLQFAKPSDTDSRATVNAFPFTTETPTSSKFAA
jgi:hypothetical protein